MIRFAITFVLIPLGNVVAADDAQQAAPTEFKVRPIGHVKKSDDRMLIVLDKKYRDGLLGLEQWSHVQVIWWFDKNDTPQQRAILQVHPRGDQNNPVTGVFACRAPVRPNLIGLSLCKVLAVKDNVVASVPLPRATPTLAEQPALVKHASSIIAGDRKRRSRSLTSRTAWAFFKAMLWGQKASGARRTEIGRAHV